jgi:hypothetical protein
METDVVANGPVVGFAFDKSAAGPSLGMALDACVVGGYIIHLGWIQNIGACRVCDMLAAGAVATFAANIPLCDLPGVDVVVDGMAAVAGGPGGALHVV